jgi:hypothetical protein
LDDSIDDAGTSRDGLAPGDGTQLGGGTSGTAGASGLYIVNLNAVMYDDGVDDYAYQFQYGTGKNRNKKIKLQLKIHWNKCKFLVVIIIRQIIKQMKPLIHRQRIWFDVHGLQ